MAVLYIYFPSHSAMFLGQYQLDVLKSTTSCVVCVISSGHLLFFGGGGSKVDANVVVVVVVFWTDFPLNLSLLSWQVLRKITT